MAGKPVHLEIPAQDTSRAQEFYKGIFGWQFQAMEGPFEYHMAQVAEDAGSAVFPGDTGAIRVYFDVDDINAGASRLQARGQGRRTAAGTGHGLVRDRYGHRGEPDRPLAERPVGACTGEPSGVALV